MTVKQAFAHVYEVIGNLPSDQKEEAYKAMDIICNAYEDLVRDIYKVCERAMRENEES